MSVMMHAGICVTDRMLTARVAYLIQIEVSHALVYRLINVTSTTTSSCSFLCPVLPTRALVREGG